MSTHDPKDPQRIAEMAADAELSSLTRQVFLKSYEYRYSYNFSWLGRPVIQYPEDLIAMQEIIWRVKPDLIIEAGIAHGGSLIFHASMLELLGGDGRVLGIDVDIRDHNRREIERHPLARRIDMLQGSSIDESIVRQVRELAADRQTVLVSLDSNHTHDHVLGELRAYSPLVTRGSYLLVFDTVIEDLPDEAFADRPWRRGNSPKTAVHEFLRESDRFEIDREIQDGLLLTVAPDGYLRCIKD